MGNNLAPATPVSIKVLKEIYNTSTLGWLNWHKVKEAKQELISRLSDLPPVTKALLGIEDDDE